MLEFDRDILLVQSVNGTIIEYKSLTMASVPVGYYCLLDLEKW
jgi:hypothetical protein